MSVIDPQPCAPDDEFVPLAFMAAPDGVATLDGGGKVPAAQMPAIALSEFLGLVASQAAMLALAGQRGDWAVRTDLDPDRAFMLIADDPTQLANWVDITGPGGLVTSVNAQTGAVVIGKADVGLGNADNTSDANKPISTAQQAALDTKAQWTLVVNESGASIANWTSVAGTWSADAGGFIKQTDATAAYRALRYTADVHFGAALIARAEVRFPASATADRRAMLALGSTASVASTSDPWAGLGENVDNVWIQRGDQATAFEAFTVNEDQWYTVDVFRSGELVGVAVDGVLIRTAFLNQAASNAGPVSCDQFMLVDFTGEVHFRNIKVWRLATPLA